MASLINTENVESTNNQKPNKTGVFVNTGESFDAEGQVDNESLSYNEFNDVDETKVAILEALFLLQREIPFFLKNVLRVLKETALLFDIEKNDGVKEQAGAGNVVIENTSSTIKGIALIRGVSLARANLTLMPQKKRSLFKTEMIPGKSIVLPQAVSSKNYTQRALEGTQAWLHSSMIFQQDKKIVEKLNSNGNISNKEIINTVYHHLEEAQIALEELTREISAARAVLSSSTCHFPSLENNVKFFTPKSIPKHIALRFDLYESDLQIIMYVLQSLSIRATAKMFNRSPFRTTAKLSKSEKFKSLNEKASFLVGQTVQYGNEMFEVIDQHRGQFNVTSFHTASSSFTSIHRECEFLSEKLIAHQIMIEGFFMEDEE
eukprot:g2497.t1